MLQLRAECGVTSIIPTLHTYANKQIFQNALSLNFAINMMQFSLDAWVTVSGSSSTTHSIMPPVYLKHCGLDTIQLTTLTTYQTNSYILYIVFPALNKV